MGEVSWEGNHGGGITVEESWRRNHGRGIMEEESWERNHGEGIMGGGIMGQESCERSQGGGIMGKQSWRRNRRTSGRHLEASGRYLGGLHLRFSPLAHRETKTKTEKEIYR